jgi:hypothetical protein
MAGTVTIPATVLDPAAGPRDFGPVTVQPADSTAVLTIDRTVASGMDATPAAEIDITVNRSADSGQTWLLWLSGHVLGGPQTFLDRQGVQHRYATAAITCDLVPLRGQRIKATIAAQNSPVTVAGSLAIT